MQLRFGVRWIFVLTALVGCGIFTWQKATEFARRKATERQHAIEYLRKRNVIVSYVDPFSSRDWRGSAYASEPLNADDCSGPRTVAFHGTTKPIKDGDLARVLLFDNLETLRLGCKTPERIDLDPESCLTLGEESLAGLGRLKSLRRLEIWGVHVTPDVIQSWRPLDRLEILVLVNTNVSDDYLPSFPRLPELRTLSFADAELSDVDASFVARYPKMERLVLKGTRVPESRVESLRHQFPDIKFIFSPQRGKRFLPYTWYE